VERALQAILSCAGLQQLCDEGAKIFKSLTGYDRVMVYRFDEDGHGEVFSEEREGALEPFLRNRYPASDIPHIARRLYIKNRVRVLVDVQYAPVPLMPRLSPISGQDLDMSMCFLRSISPIHVQYLKNMGVGATLVASLVVGGKLWGLISCHHYVPRLPQFEIRAVCELLAETLATRIAALESFNEAQAELSVRRLEQRMTEAISRHGDWQAALFDASHSLLHPVGATGAALLFDDQILTVGEVPGTHQLRDIGTWLDTNATGKLYATASLGAEEPSFEALAGVASGLLAVPVSKSPGEYLVWFRAERVRTVTWGGNPFEPVVIGNDPLDLSPRRSFSQWHQLMEGNAEPWSPADRTAARLIGDTVSDVIRQSWTVRMLIAQNQLNHMRRQVSQAAEPVVIADPSGRILVTNEAFQALMRANHPHLQWLEELANLFVDRADMRRKISELIELRRSWRGEVSIEVERGEDRPMLLRADAVSSAPGKLLGFVLLFTDSSEQRSAALARRRFQEEIVEGHRTTAVRISGGDDSAYQSLLSAVVENAQLAALEITDRVDVARMPEMLESVKLSTTRAEKILEHLLLHRGRTIQK
jgi:PAS domain-containing protein